VHEASTLSRIYVNHDDRVVRLFYDDGGRVTGVLDYTTEFGRSGRLWTYSYDDLGDLVAVTTPGTERYKSGLTSRYIYSSAMSSGPLQHNMTGIVDRAGQLHTENEYGDQLGLLAFNRVVRQRQGAGEFAFEYQDINQEFSHDYSEFERPAHQTTMIQRNGHPIHCIYNKFGNMLLAEDDVLIDSLPTLVQWRYRYNADGEVVAEMSPEGRVTQRYFGRDDFLRRHGLRNDEVRTSQPLSLRARLSFGNLLSVVKRGTLREFHSAAQSSGPWGDFFPDAITDVDPADCISKFTYEPDFQQLLSSSDPRYTTTADPDAETIRPSLPSSIRYHATLTRYEYRAPTGSPGASQYLLLHRIAYPDARLPDGTRLTGMGQTYAEYDDHGRVLKMVDPEQTVTTFEYFGPAESVREGYLKRTTVDPAGVAATTTYEVNEVGRRIAVTQPQSSQDPPDRFKSLMDTNALDQVTRTLLSAPYLYETRSYFDRNGQLERVERDIRDADPIAGAVEVRTWSYDERGNLVRESLGGEALGEHLVTHYRFDESDNRTLCMRPMGNATRWRYDDRSLPVSTTRGASSPDVSTSHIVYGPDGLRRCSIDARGGVKLFHYDAFGRLIQATDSLGNVSRRDYDKAGNVVLERSFEKNHDGTYSLLARTAYEYDELNRCIVEVANLFLNALPSADLQSAFVDAPGPGDVLSTQHFYDRKGREVRTVNPKGQVLSKQYDRLDRLAIVIDELHNTVESTFDWHGNLTRCDTRERFADSATGVTQEEVFSSFYAYDELDRLTTVTDGLGNTHEYSYDSRGSLSTSTDPLGNVKTYGYDVYGRRVRETLHRTQTGRGGGAPVPSVTSYSEFDGNGNLTASIDARLRRTQYEFDAIDRLKSVSYAGAITRNFEYDADDHLIVDLDANGWRRVYTIDSMDGILRLDVDTSSAAMGYATLRGASFAEYRYDGLRRLTRDRNEFADRLAKYDSLGRVYEESLTIAAQLAANLTPRTIRRLFDPLGNVIRLEYPDGREIAYDLDGLNRIARVENTRKGQGYPGSAALPNNYEVINRTYRGLRRQSAVLGNGCSTTYEYDGAARIIEISHRARQGHLTLQQLYDPVGNLSFRNDVSPAGTLGDVLKYDSTYWLTESATRLNIPVIDPSIFAPATAPRRRDQLDGQGRMDAFTNPLRGLQPDLAFDYDLAGNRVVEQDVGQPPLVYGANALDEYTLVGRRSLSYDANGSLSADGTWQYGYDYEGRLVHVRELASGREASFFHDARGRRVADTTGRLTCFVWDGSNILEEYQAGSVVAQYVNEHGTDSTCQMVRRDMTSGQRGEYWYHKDLVNSTRLLTDGTGGIAAEYRYSAFGVQLTPAPALRNFFMYMGRRFDPWISAYDFRAREYSPTDGRFLQRDPVRFAKASTFADNAYSFVDNNPLVATDPSGRSKQSPLTFDAIVKESVEQFQDPHLDFITSDALNRSAGSWIDPGAGVAEPFLQAARWGSLQMERFLRWIGFTDTDIAFVGMLPFAHPELMPNLVGLLDRIPGPSATEPVIKPLPESEPALPPPAPAPIQPAPTPALVMRYTEKTMKDPTDANTLRYLIEWLQEGGVKLRRGIRLEGDAALRRQARIDLTASGEQIAGLDASHLLDSVLDPLPALEPGRRTVYGFFNPSVNRSLGGQLGWQLKRMGVKVGDEFVLRFEGYPSFEDVPPSFARPFWHEPFP
jgi:RHS repeat-associated protein